jgi:hypothetical protein
MGKLLLISIVIATVVFPVRAASEPIPGRALRKVVVSMVTFNLIYFFAILYVYPRLP